MSRGRHAQPKPQTKHPARTPILIAGITAIILTLTGTTLWFAPADWIPLPKTDYICNVTGGGTLRIKTSNCGTLLYRGHAELKAGETYTITRTGNIAWNIR